MVADTEIPKGYQKTEIGVIPNDWILLTYDEIFEFLVTATYSRAQLTFGDEINYVHYGDIHTKCEYFLNLDKVELPSIKKELLKNYPLLKEGDLIVVDASEDYEGISKSVEVRNVRSKKIISGLHTFLLRAKQNIVVDGFKGYIHSNKLVKKQMNTLATGIKVYGVSKTNLKKIQIPLPPTKEEQTAIATALNDADKLIIELEKLIAKKKMVKQGAMQELLRPKEGWEVKTLVEVSKFRRGTFPQPYGLDKWYDDNSGFPFVQVFDVDDNMKLKNETKRRISSEAQKLSLFIKKGSIILTIQGSIGRIAITQYDAYMDRTLLLFQDYLVPLNKYFFMLLVHLLFEREKQKAPGGTIKTITKEALSSFPISFPSIDEQNKIAKILSDMDSEIESLEKKLNKYKMIKQGMMQNLLTGKIRLV